MTVNVCKITNALNRRLGKVREEAAAMKARPHSWIVPFCLCFAIATRAALAADAGASIDLPVLTGPPAVDGKIDATWQKAATLSLDTDFTNHRAASEPTRVYAAQDGDEIDVAFDVSQKEAQTASQETNSSSVQGDDYVGVYLFPQGARGIAYSFIANPRGARYQTSSENTAYTPQWIAVGRATGGGYAVTMRIPLRIIRSGGSTSWRAQFVRATVATNSVNVWTYDPRATYPTDPTYAGTLTDVGGAGKVALASARPQPRLQAYALSESTSKANGGSTSRIGADFAVPIAPTVSFVGTLHPDYSNVEIDQQTISPSAFARQYQEIRPFFTQAASYFNEHLACLNCPQTLYTPSIPTFGQGYAVEGTHGYASFAAFDTIGDNRNDAAQSINYNFENTNEAFGVNLQHVAVSAYGQSDVTTTLNLGYQDNQTHTFSYLNMGQDRGSLVTDASLGNYLETGFGYGDATSTYGLSLQQIGAQFDPLDGFVSQPDIYGYESVAQKTFNFAAHTILHDISATAFYARYNNHADLLSQTDASTQVNVDLKDLLSVHLFLSTTGVRTFDNEFLPFNGNGAMFGYRLNTSTPTYVMYSGGNYYHGELDSWSYVTTLPVARKVHLVLEADEGQYTTEWAGEQSTRQWLERAAVDWQFSRDASFDLGVRRIIGGNLPNSFQPLSYGNTSVCFFNPYNPGCFINAGNVTAAFHFLTAKNEFYVVYGNADSLSTEPSLFLKWIRYIGAPKGT
jgi:hypothetical protein